MPRYYFVDPAALTGVLEQAIPRQAAHAAPDEQLIPVDVYRDGDTIVIEAALPGARLEDMEITSQEGLLTVSATIPGADLDYAIREIPRGRLSRSLALPTESQVDQAKASYQDGILRITIPRAPAQRGRTIHIENQGQDGSRIVMDRRKETDAVLEAVKGQDYREVERGKRRPTPRA